MIAEAGVILDEARAAADAADRLFPLTLASGGSCEIGGNVSTNAGGTEVLAYGNTRELVLGVEVVLPTGEVWDGLRTLRKDNTGYDLKHLFIGAEGTLGVVTAAVLKLMPKPRGMAVAFVGLKDPAAALKLFHLARDRAGTQPHRLRAHAAHRPRIRRSATSPGTRDPLAAAAPLVRADRDFLRAARRRTPRRRRRRSSPPASRPGWSRTARWPSRSTRRQAFWHLRETMSEVQKLEGGSIKHDVAVPLARVPELIARASAAVAAIIPGVAALPVRPYRRRQHPPQLQPAGRTWTRPPSSPAGTRSTRLVHGIVGELGGTISAEHGIGVLKRDMLQGGQEPARDRPDAPGQARLRSQRHPQPRQGSVNPIR